MNSTQACLAYRQSGIKAKIHPVKLIAMMYERALVHLELAEEGVIEKEPQKRGEHLGKAIAIITELYASVKEGDESDAAVFLRGLYSAILVELPKVSVSGDVGILQQARRYIERLKEIWEQTALKEMQEELGARKNENGEAPAVFEKRESSAARAAVSSGVSFSI
ncbi:MAG: flagellar protein FliS [Proteobacteria bacterium]|nr:flagellar protein FliS [Pseudomonadota bacterium]MBU4296706.1 flagellar protein FliS [Pseudomonadota bacterium]MCG2748499.1 flagellar protein FliS [Desulfobulbaceae bacterium]